MRRRRAASQSADFPPHIYQALEEEYVSLHGPIRAGESVVVHLPRDEKDEAGRPVKARRDWLFHESHIKDPAAFLRSLAPAAEAASRPPPAGLPR